MYIYVYVNVLYVYVYNAEIIVIYCDNIRLINDNLVVIIILVFSKLN